METFRQRIVKVLEQAETEQLKMLRRQAETKRRKAYKLACKRLTTKIEMALKGADLQQWARD